MSTGGDRINDKDTEGSKAGTREAFALLGHEIRLDILLALLEDWRAARTEPRSYSELMERTGLEDSGKFNYHLGKLLGAYVRKVEGGYVPTGAATAVYRAVLATDPVGDIERTEFDIGESCPDCGGGLRGEYNQDFLSVTCQDCDSLAGDFTYPFPKNGINRRTDQEVLEEVWRRAEHHVSLARSGQCPFCAGKTSVDIQVDDLGNSEAQDVEITCGTCTFVVGVRLLFALLRVPRVTSALISIGVPVEDIRNWELPDPEVQVLERDPLRVTLSISTDQGHTRIIVDGGLRVQSVTVDDDPVGAFR